MEVRETQNVREIVDLYLESSTNAFKTILRIKNDWEALKHNMTNTSEMGKYSVNFFFSII